MSSAPTIAVIAPGAMGSAVAHRLKKAGCTVLTTLEGRSASTVERARKAGMEDASLGDIARRADWVLSIIPPSSAVTFAEEFKKAYEAASSENSKLAFADCNAVNPDTVKGIARIFDGSPIRFVDASIIGGPPADGYDPAFYASAAPEDLDALDAFIGLSSWGLRTVALKGEGAGVGDASALKMSYAGITKGFIGLTATMILSAHAASPATAQALVHELHESQPFFLERITRSIPAMLPKAYRWVGEMEEISAFVQNGLGDGEAHVHQGFAHLYDRVEKALPEGEDIAVLKKFVEEANATIRGSGGPHKQQ